MNMAKSVIHDFPGVSSDNHLLRGCVSFCNMFIDNSGKECMGIAFERSMGPASQPLIA